MKKYNVSKLLATSTVVLLLAACSDKNGIESQTGKADITRESLVIDPRFTMKPAEAVNVDINLPSLAGEKGFLSICNLKPGSSNNALDPVSSIDYDNCYLRATVENGQFSGSLYLPAHIQELAAVIWFNDKNRPPLMIAYTTRDSIGNRIAL